jgi:hypothetical protein
MSAWARIAGMDVPGGVVPPPPENMGMPASWWSTCRRPEPIRGRESKEKVVRDALARNRLQKRAKIFERIPSYGPYIQRNRNCELMQTPKHKDDTRPSPSPAAAGETRPDLSRRACLAVAERICALSVLYRTRRIRAFRV